MKRVPIHTMRDAVAVWRRQRDNARLYLVHETLWKVDRNGRTCREVPGCRGVDAAIAYAARHHYYRAVVQVGYRLQASRKPLSSIAIGRIGWATEDRIQLVTTRAAPAASNVFNVAEMDQRIAYYRDRAERKLPLGIAPVIAPPDVQEGDVPISIQCMCWCECDLCGTDGPDKPTETQAATAAESLGWRVYGTAVLCPDCHARAMQVKRENREQYEYVKMTGPKPNVNPLRKPR